jgi:hypothetical protein
MNSPGSISRMKLAPTVARADCSEATTQPRSSRPRQRGRMPKVSRAAYRVPSSMKTKQNPPRIFGSSSMAVSSRVLPSSPSSSAVTSAVSEVLPCFISPLSWPPLRSVIMALSSAVLVRLPLWARATVPVAVAPSVGWALAQWLAPVVE